MSERKPSNLGHTFVSRSVHTRGAGFDERSGLHSALAQLQAVLQTVCDDFGPVLVVRDNDKGQCIRITSLKVYSQAPREDLDPGVDMQWRQCYSHRISYVLALFLILVTYFVIRLSIAQLTVKIPVTTLAFLYTQSG